jgi:hypothetical protein
MQMRTARLWSTEDSPMVATSLWIREGELLVWERRSGVPAEARWRSKYRVGGPVGGTDIVHSLRGDCSGVSTRCRPPAATVAKCCGGTAVGLPADNGRLCGTEQQSLGARSRGKLIFTRASCRTSRQRVSRTRDCVENSHRPVENYRLPSCQRRLPFPPPGTRKPRAGRAAPCLSLKQSRVPRAFLALALRRRRGGPRAEGRTNASTRTLGGRGRARPRSLAAPEGGGVVPPPCL